VRVINAGSRREQERRHVLHVAALATVDGCLRDKLRLEPRAQIEHPIELLVGARIKRGVQTSGCRDLRQRVPRRQLVGTSTRLIPRISRRNQRSNK
jgi:hypothetical protein